tara:strand:- start:2020 stop:2421 length:402 start_codon:yes stop_codon:yes gene_type:complete
MDDSSTHSRSKNILMSLLVFGIGIGVATWEYNRTLDRNSRNRLETQRISHLVKKVMGEARGDDNYFSPREQRDFLIALGYEKPIVAGRDFVEIGITKKRKPYISLGSGEDKIYLPESLVNEEAFGRYVAETPF